MGKKIPVVAIIGRANVGKSSIFNRLVGYRQAIVADEAGTTRDSVTALVSLDEEHAVRLVDTAGLKRAEDDFEASIQEQIVEATEAADVILFAVEANIPMTDEDHRIAKLALKSQKPIILLMNKEDRAKPNELEAWKKSGIRDRISTSAIHDRGFVALKNRLIKLLPKGKAPEENDTLTIALVGRPNVGKSYLFNTLAKKQQAVVANVAGTTRDVNRADITYYGRTIRLLDTAGIRRPGKVKKGVEQFSVLRTMAAIDQADVCLLLMDVNELNVTMDQKLAGIIADSGKGLILVVSKWDSLEDKDAYSQNKIGSWVARNYQHVAWARLIFTSALTGQNVTNIFEQVLEIQENRAQKMATAELNKLLRKVVAHHPPAGPAGKKIYPKLKYAVQTDTNPPEVTIYGSHAKSLHFSYKRFIEKAIRENWDLDGVPLKIWLKNGEKKPSEKKK